MNPEADFFSALLHRGVPADLRAVDRAHLTPAWHPMYDWIAEFLRGHGKLPHADTVSQAFSYPFFPANEAIAYYAKAIRENAMRVALESGLSEKVVPSLEGRQAVTALEGAKAVISDVAARFREKDRGLVLPDISSNVDVRRRDYINRRASGDRLGLPTPWRAVTYATGGFLPGDAWAIIARPGVGKTWSAIAITVFLWQLGYRALFVSNETPPQSGLPRSPLHRVVGGRCIRCFATGVNPQEQCPAALTPRQRLTVRFDAVAARVSGWRLMKGILTPGEERQLSMYYRMCENPHVHGWGDLRIVGAPAINSVADLEMEIIEYQPDIVIWDSAYLAASSYVDVQKRDQPSELVKDFKRMLERVAVPGLVTWHFNRDVEEDALAASQNDVAFTDEMPKLFEVMLGLFRPPEVADAGEAVFTSLKVRDGIAMRALKTHFKMKDQINFAEIGDADLRKPDTKKKEEAKPAPAPKPEEKKS